MFLHGYIGGWVKLRLGFESLMVRVRTSYSYVWQRPGLIKVTNLT